MNLALLNLLGHSFLITWNRWQIHAMATPINVRACEIQRKMAPTRSRRYLKPWKMPTPILRNPYASQVKPNQKHHPVQAVDKPIHAMKKRSRTADKQTTQTHHPAFNSGGSQVQYIQNNTYHTHSVTPWQPAYMPQCVIYIILRRLRI